MSISRLPELNQAPSWANVRGIPAGTLDIIANNLVSSPALDTAIPRLVSIREAANQLHVHENTIRNWIDKGVLRAVRLPGSSFRRLPDSEVTRVRRGILGALAPGREGEGRDWPAGKSLDYMDSDQPED